MYLNSNRLTSSIDPVATSLTNRNLGNLTAVALEPLKILCPVDSVSQVERAISNHIHNCLLARDKAKSGVIFPPFNALFKSDEYKQHIADLFNEMASLGPILFKGRPTFICIRSEEDALLYQSAVPDLWEQCTQSSPLPYQPIGPIAVYETNTLFLCRPFFNLADDTTGPAPRQCADVRENMFTYEPMRAVFANRATYITTFAINAYSNLPLTQRALSYIGLLNAALRWDINFAATEPWTYILFERCRSCWPN